MQQLIKLGFIVVLLASVNTIFAQTAKGKPAKAKTTTTITTPAKPKKAVEMTFDKETWALGKMKKGEKRKFDYVFTNTGTDIIDIEIVSGCDCTTLDWTRKSIKPGEKGTINAIFDSTEKEITEKTVDVDIYLKNKDKKTNSQIMKSLNFTFELTK